MVACLSKENQGIQLSSCHLTNHPKKPPQFIKLHLKKDKDQTTT